LELECESLFVRAANEGVSGSDFQQNFKENEIVSNPQKSSKEEFKATFCTFATQISAFRSGFQVPLDGTGS
jgi:hypothetical protein